MTGEDYLLPYHHRLISQLLGESGRKLEMVFGGGGGGSSLGSLVVDSVGKPVQTYIMNDQ